VHPPDGPLDYGLIAEEVAEVYPELVVRDAAGAPDTVRYQLLPVLLLNELQRQAAEIAELRRDQATLQAHLIRLTEALAGFTAFGSAGSVRLRLRQT
jgi:trimeric autotransporter adhesin